MSYRNVQLSNRSNAPRTVTFANPSPVYTPQSSSRSPSTSVAGRRVVAPAQDGTSDPDTIHVHEDPSDWDADQDEMEDRRPPLHRPTDGRSAQPLLHKQDEERGRTGYNESSSDVPARRPSTFTRRSTMRSRSPDTQAKLAAKKKYTYAAFFLFVSLIAFTIQTETAEYIQHDLGWNKAYCMLYVKHGSRSINTADCLQVLHSRILDLPLAFSTAHSANTKMAYALENLLAAARLPGPYDCTDG